MTSTSVEKPLSQGEATLFPPKALRRARIVAGDYAHSSGIYDPVDVMTFTQLCVEQATACVSATRFDASDALVKEVLRVASTSCGVCKSPQGGVMEPQASESIEQEVVVGPTSATATFVASVAEQSTVIAVPPVHERAMPAQPLGELPDVRPARLWSSLLQTMKRATWSVLSSMFVRSE